jgi:NodT family efflux transporter outer membrane factor (OMF) lipoprotein
VNGLHIVGTAFIILVAGGCTSISASHHNESFRDVPGNWASAEVEEATQASSIALWWLRFDDPLLSDLIEQALKNNTSIKTSLAALRQARSLRDVSAAAMWPSLNGSASGQRNHRGSDATLAGGESTSNVFQAGIDAAWELDIFGVNRSALHASEEKVLAVEASLGDVQVSIAAEVALGYITLRAIQARLLIASESLVSQLDTLQITQWRLQAGLVTSLDAEQSRAAAEQTSALLPVLQTSLDQTSHALAVLVGQPPATLLTWLRAAGPAPQAADNITLPVPAATLRQRADVRAAEHQVSAAQAQIDQAEAARFPNFSIGGSLGWSAASLGTLTHGASVLNTLFGNVMVPLFDGGALRAQVNVQEAAYEQARQAYRSTILTAMQDVEDALVALHGNRLKLTHLANAQAAATSAAQMARQQYSSGLVDFQTVLETQRTQLGTQDSVATARADVASDQVRLYKALGGGWTADEGSRVTP